MRFRVLLLIGLYFSLIPANDAQQPIRPPATFVVIQHAYPEADVLLNNVVIITALEQGNISEIHEIYPENHRIAIVSHGGESSGEDSLLQTFREGRKYLVIMDVNSELRVVDLTRLQDGILSLLDQILMREIS